VIVALTPDHGAHDAWVLPTGCGLHKFLMTIQHLVGVRKWSRSLAVRA
jgi:hypothetical protein